MSSQNEPESARIEKGPVFVLSLILLAVIILVMCCALSFALYNQLKEPSPTPLQDIPVKIIPPAVMPAHQYLINLPLILSRTGQVSVPEQIWKVTGILNQGYELGSQRYDLATFTRLDGQATAQGYCINPGWVVPELGVEYLLKAEGIFVPLYQSDTHPIQRFLKIQKQTRKGWRISL